LGDSHTHTQEYSRILRIIPTSTAGEIFIESWGTLTTQEHTRTGTLLAKYPHTDTKSTELKNMKCYNCLGPVLIFMVVQSLISLEFGGLVKEATESDT